MPQKSSKGHDGIRRLFFDLETSPNIGLFWRPGYKLTIGHENIIKERAIICASWKWEGEKETHSISWTRDKQDDTRVVKQIAQLLNEADEVVGHNSDKFDIGWLRGRALRLGIGVNPRLVSQDTCKLARRYFNLNSYKLDYIASFLGLGNKFETNFGLWKKVLLEKCNKSLDYMIEYCERDVILLEKVWSKIKPYVPAKTHAHGGSVHVCPECGSKDMRVSKKRMTAAGYKQVQLQCGDCGKYTSVSEQKFNKK